MWAEGSPVANNLLKRLLERPTIMPREVLVRREKQIQKKVFFHIWDVKFQVFTVSFEPRQLKYDRALCSLFAKLKWAEGVMIWSETSNPLFSPHQTKGSPGKEVRKLSTAFAVHRHPLTTYSPIYESHYKLLLKFKTSTEHQALFTSECKLL